MGLRAVCNKELAAIAVWARVCHGERSNTVFQWVAAGLVFKLVAWPTTPTTSWIATLDHEVPDYAMKD